VFFVGHVTPLTAGRGFILAGAKTLINVRLGSCPKTIRSAVSARLPPPPWPPRPVHLSGQPGQIRLKPRPVCVFVDQCRLTSFMERALPSGERSDGNAPSLSPLRFSSAAAQHTWSGLHQSVSWIRIARSIADPQTRVMVLLFASEAINNRRSKPIITATESSRPSTG